MEMGIRYSHVLWDWNGTLFDDVDWCVHVMNGMLSKRGLRTISGVPEYHKLFCFPIIQYYKNVGFDLVKEPFEDLAEEYISLYHVDKTGHCGLTRSAEVVLTAIHQKNISQVILSASEVGCLLAQIYEFDITSYFDEILGLSDIYANSKIDVGLDYLSRENVKRAVMIGDTKHDFEVAKALGVDCVLIPNGHQSRETLLTCGVPVLEDISCVVQYL